MSQRGYPAAAAVDAAPMRKEWVDMLVMWAGFILSKAAAMPDLVRKRPSFQTNNGPDLEMCWAINFFRAWTGQRAVLLACSDMDTPALNGSVFDALMWIVTWDGDRNCTSWKHNVVAWS